MAECLSQRRCLLAWNQTPVFLSSIAVTTSELPSATHTWGVEGKDLAYRMPSVFFFSQSTSEWPKNKSFLHAHMFIFTYWSYTFKSAYYKDKITLINFTIPWVKVSLYKFALHSFYSVEYLTSQVHFSHLEHRQCNDCRVQLIRN